MCGFSITTLYVRQRVTIRAGEFRTKPSKYERLIQIALRKVVY